MASTAWNILEQVLEEGGFVQGGRYASGLINAERAKTNVTTDLRYRRLFTPSETGSVIDFVYEVPNEIDDAPGTPCIYFKALDEPFPESFKNLRMLTWNQWRAPTLCIVTSSVVRIYDSFARPQEDDNDESHLLKELKDVARQLRELEPFHKSKFDTGEFWQSEYGKSIDQNQRVDIAMLADLSKTEKALIQALNSTLPGHALALSTSIAHSLLGRAIFVSYLEDRGLLESAFFQREYNCASFKELLDDKEATYAFFEWLRETFNGNLFPFQENERSLVKQQPHLGIVKEFLSGTDMSTYSPNNSTWQRRLWPYKFNFIPIELLSSIYEMFAHSRNSSAAEAGSIHYTRLPLVELVLSLAMRNLIHTAKILDPACGSGIFLVEAFRRLALMRANEYGHPVQREELHEMLRSQIFGIDIDRDAIYGAAFSLYLALLELDPYPQPLGALKFPYLLPVQTHPDQVANLYIQDFCNTEHVFNQISPFANKEFDLIVGNPPWTALKKATAPRDPDNPEAGRQWGIEYCENNKIPDKKPDQAFMLRVRDFAQAKTRIAFIVGSRLFFQQEDTSWLNTFLSTNTIETVVNLSDLVGENILFGGTSSTRLPASVILFRAITPAVNNDVMYITPKWYQSISKRREIIVASEDIHYLSQRLLQTKPFLWKSAFRGTARDYRLLRKLQLLPSLDMVLFIAGVSTYAHRGITFGQSEQKNTPQELLGKPFLASESDARYSIDITPLPLFERPKIAKKSNTKFLNLPALVLWRSLRYEGQRSLENAGWPYAALAEGTHDRSHLVIDQMYYGIPSSTAFPSLIYRLNAILNSKLAFYMAFMFGSVLGWGDRKLIEEGDWLQVHLPDSILKNDTDPPWEEILQQERWLRENWQPYLDKESPLGLKVAQEQDMLEKAIFNLYDLSEQEILLVEETIRYGINPLLTKKLHTSNAFAKATLDDLQKYAKRLCVQLNGVLHYGELELIANVVAFDQPSPLCACRFTQKVRGNNVMVNVTYLHNIENVISQLAQNLRTEIADHVYARRSLRVYENDGFWIIKGAEKRLWSESAAMNDADIVVCEHMEAVVD